MQISSGWTILLGGGIMFGGVLDYDKCGTGVDKVFPRFILAGIPTLVSLPPIINNIHNLLSKSGSSIDSFIMSNLITGAGVSFNAAAWLSSYGKIIKIKKDLIADEPFFNVATGVTITGGISALINGFYTLSTNNWDKISVKQRFNEKN
ncbi:MAG: hypothetical protein RsTaC01_0252 [Candidatus Paraimprobicoccus trichonymphae]|uniref:Uncharacterized protein n=1 Tax=Candidatus Paraimprobicoccus trichonymphae TaxID=3033793 RepID=A0AA48I2D6_9FIRM|nr:MAG: hypothetical protein RsTaC01_0252 [Candidatus Paraimprobicoccus trichonymphae]